MVIRYFIPAIIWACAIFMVISISPSKVPKIIFKIPFFDLWVHFGLFLGFGFLTAYGFFMQHKTSFIQRRFAYLAVASGLFYGIITEIAQLLFLSERKASISDALANLFGTVFGVVFFGIVLILCRKFK